MQARIYSLSETQYPALLGRKHEDGKSGSLLIPSEFIAKQTYANPFGNFNC